MVDWSTLAGSVVAAGGGGAAVAYAIFKGFGSKWLEHRFAAQLERSRQDHATETEHLKFRIAGLLDRTTKLNQREFEILPDIWQKANAAYQKTGYLLSPMRTYPDFWLLPEDKFDEWLGSVSLGPTQKHELKAASKSDRSALFYKMMQWKELRAAQLSANKFSKALQGGSIYLHPETHVRLTQFRKQMFDALHDYSFNLRHPRERGDPPIEKDDSEAFRKEGGRWFEELGDFLRDRYWGSDQLPKAE